MTVLGAAALAAGLAVLAWAPEDPPPPVHLRIEVVEVPVFEDPSDAALVVPLEELAAP